ncbi:MAG: AMP-dependent synthetase and ligase [Candidatus Gottesmanbacteria bacterium GW2011_GWB1_43_11]|uniref:AMP-dependent synthetase and ligase n=1 Tax=Candidatus Gottesmanbacteria bacterium GW2011_GWB1_43_11 TaxID=1618446 RepID=A0A0G1CP29_9BACT|nr:MAG: AMP-dependent synthetase and ligase [Candidatus Gottesmanbacteria bacterium GW2011_GWB1_43_11]
MTSIQLLVKNGRPITYQPPVKSVFTLLQNHARDLTNHIALSAVNVDTGERTQLTFQQLLNRVVQAAHYLQALGIKKGDRFAILMSNTLEVLILELAGGVISAATVPLDAKRDTFERKLYKLQDTKSQVLFIKAETATAEIQNLARKIKVSVFPNTQAFFKMIEKYPIQPTFEPSADLHSLYLILYTSGTTALPKGVPITAQALLANAEGIAKWQKLTSRDRFNIILPLHHINSTTMSFATLLVGGTIVVNSRYSASRFWQVIDQEKCTITSVVPTIIHDLLTRQNEVNTKSIKNSSLKRILVGSAPVLPEERFYEHFKIRVVQGYGQTETALRVTGVPIDLKEAQYKKQVKENTIGAELMNCNVAILKKNGTEAHEKETGEICIRGPIMAEGYLNNKQATQESFHDGWFHSGDLGYWKIHYTRHSGKPEGRIQNPNQDRFPNQVRDKLWTSQDDKLKYFYIIGRLKEIIIKGGVNLSPALIEDALLNNFSEINEVSVVGFPDARMGEEVAAVVVLKRHSGNPDSHQTSNEVGSSIQNPDSGVANAPQNDIVKKILDAAAQNKISGLSPYEMPKKVFVVDSLPKTSTGKIQRVEVKKLVAEKMKPEKLTYYYVRQIKPQEIEILKKAVEINNDRWTGLPATLHEFRKRAKNGIVLGVFNDSAQLVGSLCYVQMLFNQVKQLKTWREATANGTLSNHNPQGDTLLCVAISITLPNPPLQREGIPPLNPTLPPLNLRGGEEGLNNVTIKQFNNSLLTQLAKQHIQQYANSNLDHVLNFHRKPKGDLPGATVWKILANGRPDDREACGYNVLMKYPQIPKGTKIIHSASSTSSIMLIEHALMFAQKQGIKHVIAFSRPAGFYKWLRVNKVV